MVLQHIEFSEKSKIIKSALITYFSLEICQNIAINNLLLWIILWCSDGSFLLPETKYSK